MKQKLAKFMYGRYGADQLSRALTYISLALIVISMFIPRSVQALRSMLIILVLFCLVFSYYRTFSKKLDKRRAENARYLKLQSSIFEWWKLRRDMWKQRKEYKFFKCPSCKAVLRVPKGKGKIRIVCKKCGAAFEKKS